MQQLLVVFLTVVCGLVHSENFLRNCQTEQHRTDSQAYFDQGEILWNAEKYDDSIHFYRAAVRLCPENFDYWWKLGISEWRSKDYGKAIRRFNHVQQNLREFDKSNYELPLHYQEIYDKFSKEPLPNALEVELFESISQFPPLLERADVDFLFLGSESSPFVVRNFVNVSSHSNLSILTNSDDTNIFSFLLSHYSDYPTELYPQNMLVRPNRVFKKSIKEALDFFAYPEGAYTAVDISERGTYIQLNLRYRLFQELMQRFATLSINATTITSDFSGFAQSLIANVSKQETRKSYENSFFDSLDLLLPQHNIFDLFREKTHWYMMLIGEEGSGMFHHVDNLPVSSWQVQLEGDKVWIICATYDSNKARNCSQVTLHPGDFVYYPRGYSHQTLCKSTPTISISGSLIHPNDYELFTLFICQECKNSAVGYKFHLRFCELVQFSCSSYALDEL